MGGSRGNLSASIDNPFPSDFGFAEVNRQVASDGVIVDVELQRFPSA